MPIKAVIFDLFDTLLPVIGGDAFYEPALQKLYKVLLNKGVKVSFEEFRQAYFEVRDKLYTETASTLEEPHFKVRLSRTLKKLGYDYEVSHPVVDEGTKAFAEEFKSYVSLDDETVEVLRRLHGKYKLGIVSNISIPELAWELLEKFDLKKYFDTIIISGDVNRRKPHPEIFEKALKNLGVKASETLFVGDTLSTDIKGAKNVGMYTILLKRTNSPKTLFWSSKEKTQIQPDKVITSLNKILELLKD